MKVLQRNCVCNFLFFLICVDIFVVHRATHHSIISIVKPTRCTNVSNLFYFGMTLYMFRTVFLSIISSSRLYIQQQTFVRKVSVWLLYVQSSAPDDGRKDSPKHVECLLFLNINQLDALNFIISLFHACTCFEYICSLSGGQILYYTVSGGRLVHGTATYRCDDTRDCIIQYLPS